MKKTCLKPLFSCYKPKGACVGQLAVVPGGLEARQCYANGVRLVAFVTATSGTLSYRTKKGKVCVKGDATQEGDDAVITYAKRKKRWTVRRLADDSIQITCPNRRVETWTAAQVEVQPPTCGGLGDTDCVQGTCPWSRAPQPPHASSATAARSLKSDASRPSHVRILSGRGSGTWGFFASVGSQTRQV